MRSRGCRAPGAVTGMQGSRVGRGCLTGQGAVLPDGRAIVSKGCSGDTGSMPRDEQAALLALVSAAERLHIGRHRVAQLIDSAGSAIGILEASLSGFEPIDVELADRLRSATDSESVAAHRRWLDDLATKHPDVRLVTLLDDGYPTNLRQAYDRTPLLFVRGHLDPDTKRAIAVVGTRKPSPSGLDQAGRFAAGLAEAGVAVVSGLAAGIDTAAHEAALEARGTTIAVLGHGILTPVYPRSNTHLAIRIASSGGGLVSQFWPTAPPSRASFPLRNVTTSALSLGTVVVEAGATSGARQQARKCLEHGRQLFLLDQLVTHQAWARSYADRPGVAVVSNVSEVIARLDALGSSIEPVQLVLG